MISKIIPPLFDCNAEPPIAYSCNPDPCVNNIIDKRCIHRADLSKTIIVQQDTFVTKIRLTNTACKNLADISANCTTMKLYSKMGCDPLFTIDNIQSDSKLFTVKWPARFGDLDSGIYYLDIIVGGKVCTTLPIYKQKCTTTVHNYANESIKTECNYIDTTVTQNTTSSGCEEC